MKIAFIIGPQGKEYQDTYYDKFLISPERPWLKKVPRDFHISDDGNNLSRNNSNSKKYVRLDVAIAYCLKFLYPNKNITILPAEKISNSEFKKYDLIINQFMDLLIVPFMKKFEKKEIPHEKLRLIYENHKDKIYPPVQYANLIYDKCSYYTYLEKIGMPVAPTLCISRDEYISDKYGSAKLVTKLARKQRWKKIFAKPVHGTDSGNIKLIGADISLTKKTEKEITEQVVEYMDNTFRNLRYPSIVFQKFFKDFEKTVPQIRMYYIGDEYQYSILNYSDGSTERPKQDSKYGVQFRQLDHLKKACDKIIKSYDKFFKGAPVLISRIDFGCCLSSTGKKANKFFVNEIEFNPGLYLHMDGDNKFNFDYKISRQLGSVFQHYERYINV